MLPSGFIDRDPAKEQISRRNDLVAKLKEKISQELKIHWSIKNGSIVNTGNHIKKTVILTNYFLMITNLKFLKLGSYGQVYLVYVFLKITRHDNIIND